MGCPRPAHGDAQVLTFGHPWREGPPEAWSSSTSTGDELSGSLAALLRKVVLESVTLLNSPGTFAWLGGPQRSADELLLNS
jgi:hypothetical protein